MSVPVVITVELDAEELAALDWDYGAPAGQQVARAELPRVIRGRLEADLGRLIAAHREAEQGSK